MIGRNKKAQAEIASIVLSVFVITIAMGAAMIFLIYGQGKDLENIQKFNFISEGNMYVDNTMQLLLNYETNGESIREKIREDPFGQETETLITETLDELMKIITEIQYFSVSSFEKFGTYTGGQEMAEIVGTYWENFEKTEITNPNKFDVRISGTSVFVDISIYRIEDSSGIYELKIKKGAKEEVIGGLEESSNLYMETEELVDVEGEKITLTLILNKKQELKNTLFRKE